MRANPHRSPIPTGLFFRSALADAAYALLHGEHARTERGAVLLDAVLDRGITTLPERGTRPGPLLTAWLRRDLRRLREPVQPAGRTRRGGGGGGERPTRRDTATTPPSPRPAHVSPPTAADLRARLLWALEKWLPPLPERRMPTMKRRNPKTRSVQDRAMLMYRAMLRQEAAEGAHTYGHGGGLTPEYLAESNRLRGVSHGTRLKIAALNQQMGGGMARTSLAYDKWEKERGLAPVRRNPRGLAGWSGETIPGVTGKVYTRDAPHGRYRVYFAREGFSRGLPSGGEWQAVCIPPTGGGHRRFVAQHQASAADAMRAADADEQYNAATRKRTNPRAPKKEDRATKAVRRVTEAFKAGVLLHWRGRTADGRRDDQGTAGYYRSGGRASHSTGTAEYAILGTPGRGGRDATFDTAFGAADHLVEWIGVTNAIDALKAAARKHGTEYANLDTSIRWGR